MEARGVYLGKEIITPKERRVNHVCFGFLNYEMGTKCLCCNDETGVISCLVKAWPGNSFLLPISSIALTVGIYLVQILTLRQMMAVLSPFLSSDHRLAYPDLFS